MDGNTRPVRFADVLHHVDLPGRRPLSGAENPEGRPQARAGRELQASRRRAMHELELPFRVGAPGDEVETPALGRREALPIAGPYRERTVRRAFGCTVEEREDVRRIDVGLLLVVHCAASDDNVPMGSVQIGAGEIVEEELPRCGCRLARLQQQRQKGHRQHYERSHAGIIRLSVSCRITREMR